MTAVILFLLFVGAQFLAGVLALIVSHPEVLSGEVENLSGLTSTPVNMGLSLLLVEGLCSILLWFWLKRSSKKMTPVLLKGRLSVYMLRAIGSVLLLSLGLSLMLERFDLSDGGMQDAFAAMLHNPLCLLLLCVVGPLTEELFFRAGILRVLYIDGLPGWVAAVISAFAFALVHGNPVQGIPAFIVGVVLGLFYLRTGNLKLCVPAHIANNTLAVVLMLLPGGMTFTESWPFVLLLSIGLIFFIAGAYGTWRILK